MPIYHPGVDGPADLARRTRPPAADVSLPAALARPDGLVAFVPVQGEAR
jgi:hypothetical protein